MPHVFLCYDENDTGLIEDIVARLRIAGFSDTYDSVAISRQADWPTAVEQAIGNSFAVIILLTPEAISNPLIVYARGFARADRVPIIPVLYRDGVDSSWLGSNYIDLTEQANIKVPDLSEIIAAVRRTYDQFAGAVPETPSAPANKGDNQPALGRENGSSDFFSQTPGINDILRDHEIVDPEPSREFLSPQSDDPTLKIWLNESLNKLQNGDTRERIDAARALGDLRDSVAIDALLKALTDFSIQVRKAATASLGHIKNPRAIPGLVEVLESPESDSELRETAALALGNIGHVDGIAPLQQALNHDGEMFVRISAARALGMIGDPSASSVLSGVIRGARYNRLRRAAVLALGEIGNAAAIQDLLSAISDDDEEVRRDAALMIIKLWGPRALNQSLLHYDWRVREAAAWALGETRSPDVVPQLVEMLGDEDRVVRQSAVWALGSIGDALAVPDLLQRLELDRNARVLWLTIWALGNIADPTAIPALSQMLIDDDEGMREAAAKALGKIAHPNAVPPLRATILNEFIPKVQMAAIEALSQIHDPQVVQILTQALEDENAEVRQTTARSLQMIGTPEAIEALNRWRGRNSRDQI
ncbi:MAG: TIR domain-containing protein [Chloroflexi bacterium]|nr:TIR domain-containing protein [Chloroflexota bacterium]